LEWRQRDDKLKERIAKIEKIIAWHGNANLPIGTLGDANREIGVPGIQPIRLVPNVR